MGRPLELDTGEVIDQDKQEKKIKEKHLEAELKKWEGIIDRHPESYQGEINDSALIPKHLLEELGKKFKFIKEYANKNIEDKKTIETSKFIDEEKKIIIEQVWDRKNGSRFCVYDHITEKIKYVKTYSCNGIKYIPFIAEEIEKGAVLLPSQAEDYFENDILDKEIIDFAEKWLDAPPEIMKFGLWNTKLSWVFELCQSLNYLRARGDTGTGKTRYLDVWGQMHYKPIFTTGSATPAPLFRIIDKWKGTIVMDEADLKQSDESEQIIKILNNGFERGKFIMRCDQNDANKISFFEPFCPKILATRRGFTDKATESRCITHITSQTNNKDIPVNIDDKFRAEGLELRNKLLMWRFRNYFEIEERMKEKINLDLGDVEPRVKQIVQSYFYLFSNDEEGMKGFIKYIKSYQKELIDERQGSFDGMIIEAIFKLIDRRVLDFTTGDIITEGELKGYDGLPMKPRGLTPKLKSLGFKKGRQSRRGQDIKKYIPVDKEHLRGLFKRYGFDYEVLDKLTLKQPESQEIL